MSQLMTGDMTGDMFDFSFPHNFMIDPSLLEMPTFTPGHARSSSSASILSSISHASTVPTEFSGSRAGTPKSSRPATPVRRSSSVIRHHGPILLPKIRSQDQAMESSAAAPAPRPSKRRRTTPPASQSQTPPPVMSGHHVSATFRPVHTRSFTNPEPTVSFNMSLTPPPEEQLTSSSLLCSPAQLARDVAVGDGTSALERSVVEKYGFPTYGQVPSYNAATTSSPSMTPSITAATMPPTSDMYHAQADAFMFPSLSLSKASTPFSLAGSVEPMPQSQPTTTLLTHLTASNPAPSLVRTISFPHRDPNAKHFWWDVRQVRPWSSFTVQTIMSLPGALASLTTPIPQSHLVMPNTGARHPETEAQLHSTYASHYIPRLNSALAATSAAPMQFTLPTKTIPGLENLVTAHVAGDSASAAAIFGGKPSARVVGLIRSFDRFNTGMRVEGNIKRVEYLRGLAALHHAMREHGCRYGFILTEIELVVVRNGDDRTPHFGYLEVSSVQLAAAGEDDSEEDDDQQLTACLALWGLAQMAAMDAQTAAQNGVAVWKAEIGAPAEGTRKKALARDNWMPQPQLAEKREAKRTRGWVLPEDTIGRKELGKRGVRYGAC